jgi:hypothetical protein
MIECSRRPRSPRPFNAYCESRAATSGNFVGEWLWLDRHGQQVDVSKFGAPITHRHAAMASRRGDLTVRAAPSDFESQHGLAPLDSGSRRRLSLSQLGSCEYSAEQSPISGSPSRRLTE